MRGIVKVQELDMNDFDTLTRRTRMNGSRSLTRFGLVAAALFAAMGVRADAPAAATPAATPAPAAAPAAATAAAPAAAPAATGPTISGYIDGTYSYDFRNPANQTTNLRAYDAVANSFRLDSAHVQVAGGLGDVNYNISTDFGSDAAIDASADPFRTKKFLTDTITGMPSAALSYIDLEEAYVTFKDPIAKAMGMDILVKAGKFVTPEGIEVIGSGSDPTISRGYLFALAEPFTHTGMEMTWSKGPLTLTGGIVNGMDQIVDINTPKMALGIIALNMGDKIGTVQLSGCGGAEQPLAPGFSGRHMNSVDVTGVFKFVPKTDLNWQANYKDEKQATGGNNKQGGAGLQPVIHFSDAVSLGLRIEYYELKLVGVPFGMGSLGATNETATLAWAFETNMTLRYEIRHDDSKQALFEDSFSNYRKSTLTGGVEFLVTF